MPSNGRRTRLWPQPDESTVKQKLLAGEHGADIFGGYRITSCNYNSDSDWYCSHQYTDYPDADSYHSIDRFGFYTSNNPDGSTENLHLKDKKAEYHGPGEQGLEDCSEGMNWKALPNIPDPCFRRVNRLGSWFWKQLKEAEKEQAELEEDLRRMNEWREQQKQPQQPEQQQQQRQRKQQRRRKDDQQAKVPDALQCSNNSVLELLDDENVQLEDIVPTTVSRSTAKSSGNSEVEISGSASSTTKSFLEAIPQNPTLGKRVEHAGSDLGNNVVQPAPVVNPNETTEIGPARRNTVIPNPPPNKSGTTRKTKKQEPKKQEQRKQEENKRKRSEKEKAEKRHSEEQGTGEKLAETDSHSKDRRKKPKTK